MRCCEIAISLDNQAYCAFKGESFGRNWKSVARRTLVLSERRSQGADHARR
jgi:hypothetical protein